MSPEQLPAIVDGNKKYHSKVEKRLVEDILKVNLAEADRELDTRPVFQHKDKITNIDTFNAFSRKVVIRDNNGEQILIDNGVEMRKQKNKNAGKTGQPQITTINLNNSNKYEEDEIIFDDE